MAAFDLTATSTLLIEEGDLTRRRADAIVNAANERLLGGGGVDGAVHRAAGPELLEACRTVPEVAPGVRCPAGEARITPGFHLLAPHVIHAVGPVYRSAAASAPVLASAYRSALDLANAHGLTTLAFPAISCGVYGYPAGEAAEVAIAACREGAGALHRIVFVLFGEAMYATWREVAVRLLAPHR